MTIPNVVAGFRVTGICPFNRNAISLPSEEPKKFNPEALPRTSGIKYIPLYSPVGSSQKKKFHDVGGGESSPFTSPNQFDRYKNCDFSLSHYSSTPVHLSRLGRSNNYSFDDLSAQSISPHCSMLERSSSEPCVDKHFPMTKQLSLKKFLNTPRPPCRHPTEKPKSSGRVLTSLESIKIMEEREEKKKEEARLKEERKRAREEKKLLRETLEKEKKARNEVLKSAKKKPSNGHKLGMCTCVYIK